MKTVLTLLLIIGSVFLIQARSYQGYLVTKNDFHLTGHINVIRYEPQRIVVEFVNDFGDVYQIHPALVKGFSFTEDGQTYNYISRFHENRWLYLEVMHLGRYLSLYQAPPTSERWVDGRMLGVIPAVEQYWLQFRRGEVEPVRRGGFKRQIRKLFEGQEIDDFSGKLGKSGYKYRNLYDIVVEYNELAGRRRGRL